jgi:hypothetical protein
LVPEPVSLSSLPPTAAGLLPLPAGGLPAVASARLFHRRRTAPPSPTAPARSSYSRPSIPDAQAPHRVCSKPDERTIDRAAPCVLGRQPTPPLPRRDPNAARPLCRSRPTDRDRLGRTPAPPATASFSASRDPAASGPSTSLTRRRLSRPPPPASFVGHWSPAALLLAASAPRRDLLFPCRRALSASAPSLAARPNPSGGTRPS